MTNNLISHIIAIISSAYRNNLQYVAVPRTKIAKAILSTFYTSGLISSYTLDYTGKNYLVYLQLTTSSRNLFFQIKNVSAPGRRSYITYRALKYKYRGCPFVLISSKKGIVARSSLIRQTHQGGELLAVLSQKVKLRK